MRVASITSSADARTPGRAGFARVFFLSLEDDLMRHLRRRTREAADVRAWA